MIDGQQRLTTLQLVLADSFTQFEIGPSTIAEIENMGISVIQNLLPALNAYMFSFSGGDEAPALPDVSAVIYALDNQFGTTQSALVEVLTGVPEVARGQTVIGLMPTEKIVMIAGDAALSGLAFRIYSEQLTEEEIEMEMGAILFSKPDNAMVVTDIDASRMHTMFLDELFLDELQGNEVFMPLVSD